MLARVLQTLQMSILGGITARLLVPRTPVLVRVLQTLQMSILGGLARIATILAAFVLFSSFFSRRSRRFLVVLCISSFSEVPRFFRRGVAPSSSSFARADRASRSRRALSRRPFPVARGRSESSSRASRSDARVSSRSDATPRRSRRRRSATLSNARPRRAGGFRRRRRRSRDRSRDRLKGAPARDRG